jgi:hypothetical protein
MAKLSKYLIVISWLLSLFVEGAYNDYMSVSTD